MFKRYLSNSWLVLALSFFFGSALAGIYLAVADKIDENKLNETLSQIPALVPGATGGEAANLPGCTAFKATKDGKIVGWVLPASGGGFADVIELLIGVNASATEITGLYVLGQKETPGLGNKIIEEVWRKQFTGKPTSSPLTVVKLPPSGNEIQAVTGATISSDAVCHITNEIIQATQAELAEAAQKEP